MPKVANPRVAMPAMTLNFDMDSFSVDAWVNLQGSGTPTSPTRTLVEKYDGLGGGYALQLAGQHICFFIRSSSGSEESLCTAHSVPATGWHLLVWSMDRESDEVRIYVDGALEGTFSIAGFSGPITSSADLEIGRSFEGWIDELEIFDAALDTEEIATLYGAGGRGKCKTP